MARVRRTRRCGHILALAGAVLALVLGALTPAIAAESGHSMTVDGLTVYLGLMPAEIVRGRPPSQPGAQAHGGPPSGMHDYHVLVAVFDAATGARIEKAKIGARVSALGVGGPYKTLEPMTIAGTVTYGNYFTLPNGPYTIDVDIERSQGPVKVRFRYGH